MGGLMERGMSWLAAKQRKYCGVPAVYVRMNRDGGEASRHAVTVVPARPAASGDLTVEPIRVNADEFDFLITAADLPFDPRAEDRILVTRAGKTDAHAVLPRGDSPSWRWSDPQRTIRRIHTRLVDSMPEGEG